MKRFKNQYANCRFKIVFTMILIIGSMFFLLNTVGHALAAYNISGYIKSDVTNSTSSGSFNSGFSVNIDGTGYKASTDANGYFELNNIPESQASYTLKISKICYLTRTISNVKLTGNIVIGSQTSPIMLWAGDIPVNGQQDNTINMSDIIEFAKKFNSVAGDSHYTADIDINKDNAINMADIVIIARNFNKTDSSYPVVDIPVPSISPTPTPIVSPSPSVSGAPYKIFILSGQSNMCGIGNNYYLTPEQAAPVEGVKIYAAGTVESSMANFWGTLKPGYGGGSGCFGPELTFGRDMAQKLPNNKVLIIKIAWSGTSLWADWRSPSAGGTTGKLWTDLLSNANKAIAALDPSIKYEIAGMCWMQGEADACASNIASEYEPLLTAFIGDARKAFNAPNMPFVIGMIDDTSTWPYYAMVREAEQNVSQKVPHVGIFDTKDLDTDGSHYKNQGLLDMGSLFASTMYKELTK